MWIVQFGNRLCGPEKFSGLRSVNWTESWFFAKPFFLRDVTLFEQKFCGFLFDQLEFVFCQPFTSEKKAQFFSELFVIDRSQTHYKFLESPLLHR